MEEGLRSIPASRTFPTTPTISRQSPGPVPPLIRFPRALDGRSQYCRAKFSDTITTRFRS